MTCAEPFLFTKQCNKKLLASRSDYVATLTTAERWLATVEVPPVTHDQELNELINYFLDHLATTNVVVAARYRDDSALRNLVLVAFMEAADMPLE